jgi:hypothetical protein
VSWVESVAAAIREKRALAYMTQTASLIGVLFTPPRQMKWISTPSLVKACCHLLVQCWTDTAHDGR